MTISYGYTTVAASGFPEQIAPNALGVHRLLIQALPTNSNPVYIGNTPDMNRTTGVGVIAILNAPPATGELPSYEVKIDTAYRGANPQELWLDVETNGEGVVASGVY